MKFARTTQFTRLYPEQNVNKFEKILLVTPLSHQGENQ